MSLLTDSFEECVMIDKTTVNDGYGGFTTTWVDGATFVAAIVLDLSTQARIAEKDGVSNLYTVTTPRSITLEYHNVFRRVSDGKIFRVTADGNDKHTPSSATLDMRVVSAEEWTLNG